ncbi:MAG: (Fe-S)-binding protein [Nanoarchaeota archaeon]|nr:(Fe-S)-binding protein [Nanoarchaeota archaeon]
MGVINWFKDFGKNTLYYPGCLTKGVLKQEFENYKNIFAKLEIDYILIPNDEVCCGSPVINAGYKKDAQKLARKNFELFKKYNVAKIITNCPSCYNMFKEEYPKFIREWNIEVEHASSAILKALKEKQIKFNGPDEVVTFHDPCHLGRYSNIYNEPREVIEILGGKIIEMRHNKENSLCCGGGGGVRANFPELSEKIAKRRANEIPKEVEKIISPCGLCFSNLQTASNKSEEFSTFVLRRLSYIKS